jgi:SPASM domain peptide maturase of grasp-with-spasm system
VSVFKLFANIIPVKGAKRATLCDLLRGRIKLIPIDLFDLLERYPNHSPDEVIADHPEHAEVIKSYFDALLEDHWGFLCDEPEAFPALDLSYDAPARINNGIIDVDHTSNHDYKNLITQLNQLGCNFLQVRIYDSTSMDELTQILEATKGSRIRGLEIFVRYQNDLDEEDYLMLMQQYRRLYSLVIHDAPLDKAIKARDSWGDLRFQRLRLEGSSACGVISKQDFVSELSVFTEGLSHNSCLNRKLSVDTPGEFNIAGQIDWGDVAAIKSQDGGQTGRSTIIGRVLEK